MITELSILKPAPRRQRVRKLPPQMKIHSWSAEHSWQSSSSSSSKQTGLILPLSTSERKLKEESRRKCPRVTSLRMIKVMTELRSVIRKISGLLITEKAMSEEETHLRLHILSSRME